jgi:hypothetical protein
MIYPLEIPSQLPMKVMNLLYRSSFQSWTRYRLNKETMNAIIAS